MPPMTTPDPNTHHRRNRMAERSKPEIDRPQGPAPTELLSTDEVVGDGEEAGRGDVVDVHYVGISHSTGEQFDASWDRGEPLRDQLGVGRRRLDSPAALGYGDMGAPPVIAPGESLVFVCDLVAVHKR